MDSYQAVYDAVRSRISNVDVSHVIEQCASRAFDLGHTRALLQQEFVAAAYEMQRPSVVFRPQIRADGDQWCALLGEDLQVGVSGFGPTPAAAMAAFDLAFWKGQTPRAIQLSAIASSRAEGSAGKDALDDQSTPTSESEGGR